MKTITVGFGRIKAFGVRIKKPQVWKFWLGPILEEPWMRFCLYGIGGCLLLYGFFIAVDYYFWVVDGTGSFLFHKK